MNIKVAAYVLSYLQDNTVRKYSAKKSMHVAKLKATHYIYIFYNGISCL